MQLLNLANQIFLGLPNGLGSSKFTFYNQFSNFKYCQIRNEMENPKLVQFISYFETKLNLSKNSNKNYGELHFYIESLHEYFH